MKKVKYLNKTNFIKDSLRVSLNNYKEVVYYGLMIFLISMVLVLPVFAYIWNFNVIDFEIAPSDFYLNLFIVFLAIFTLLTVFISGYEYRAIKGGIDKSDKLAPFNNWLNMFVEGFKLIIVRFIYALLPLILFLIGGYFEIFSLWAIGMILYVLIYFMQIMGTNNFIYNGGKISEAFNFNEIIGKIKDIGWTNYIIYIIFAAITASIIYCGLIIIFFIVSTILGLVLGAFSMIIMYFVSCVFEAYITIFISRSFGLIFNEIS